MKSSPPRLPTLRAIINSLPLSEIQAVWANLENAGDEPEIVGEMIVEAMPELDEELVSLLTQYFVSWVGSALGGGLTELELPKEKFR